jgi:predicted Zn-dependent protease
MSTTSPARALSAACLLTLALASCSINPVSGRPDLVFTSEKGEVEKAKKVHPLLMQQFGGPYDNPALQQYVNDVGQRAAKVSERPELAYTFTVLDSQDINAFTTGGGYVYITRGIMNYLNSEAELLAVLGHEIGHITARHPVRQQTGSTLSGIGAMVVGIATGSGDLAGLADYAGQAMVRGYGRDMELEADRLGAEYLAGVGLEPDHMIDVVRLLKNQELFEVARARAEKRDPNIYHGVFSTHPDNDERLREVVRSASKLKLQERVAAEKQAKGIAPDAPIPVAAPTDPGREKYLKAIEGMPVGTSRPQGVLKGNRFYHADLGITMAFPSGWKVQNSQDRLVAISPDKGSIFQMKTESPPPGMKPQQFLGRLLANQNAGTGEPIEINGLSGYTTVVRAARTNFGVVPARHTVVYFNSLAYVFSGASRASTGVPQADPLFMSTMKTFRRLKSNEFELAEPYKIKTLVADSKTTIADLAKTSPIKEYPAEQLRLMNDLYPDKEPKPGQMIKVVTE